MTQMPVEKRETGFRFGRYSLRVTRLFGECRCDGRTYKLVQVETQLGASYYALRLYNGRGHFIKQLLFERSVVTQLADLLLVAVVAQR